MLKVEINISVAREDPFGRADPTRTRTLQGTATIGAGDLVGTWRTRDQVVRDMITTLLRRIAQSGNEQPDWWHGALEEARQ